MHYRVMCKLCSTSLNTYSASLNVRSTSLNTSSTTEIIESNTSFWFMHRDKLHFAPRHFTLCTAVSGLNCHGDRSKTL